MAGLQGYNYHNRGIIIFVNGNHNDAMNTDSGLSYFVKASIVLTAHYIPWPLLGPTYLGAKFIIPIIILMLNIFQ